MSAKRTCFQRIAPFTIKWGKDFVHAIAVISGDAQRRQYTLVMMADKLDVIISKLLCQLFIAIDFIAFVLVIGHNGSNFLLCT